MRKVSRRWESRVRMVLAWFFTAGLAAGLFVSNEARATTYTVTTTADDATGVSCTATPSQCNTLRDAVFSASSGNDSINFSSLFNSPQTITLTGPEIVISHDVTISGPGANLLAISGNNVSRIFRVASGAVLTLAGATIRDGLAGDVGGGIVSDGGLSLSFCVVTGNTAPGSNTGGGVYEAGGSAIFFACTFDDNSAGTGGAVQVINASATFTNCTLSGNVASVNGGAIDFHPFTGAQELTVLNTTIAYNRSPATGGILADSSTTSVGASATTIGNTLFGNNGGASLGTTGANPSTFTSSGFNLASDGGGGFLTGSDDQTNTDPKLGPLSLNGGTTPSHALLGGSPALDAGKNASSPLLPFDQRSALRPFTIPGTVAPSGGDHSDIGAVEMQAIIVNSTGGLGTGNCTVPECTLLEAINTANSNGAGLDDILFASPLFDSAQAIDLPAVLPDITGNLTINGPAANLLTVRRDYSAAEFRIFNIPNAGLNVAINGMTISNGKVTGGFGGGVNSFSPLALNGVNVTGNNAGYGGGVRLSGADGTFTNSTFSNNVASQEAGAIYYSSNSGNRLVLANSTISGNVVSSGSGYAGGIEHACNATCLMSVVNSTIANNIGANGGGIISIFGGGNPVTTLRNSIVADNVSTHNSDNLGLILFSGTGTITSLGFNLANDGGGGFLTATGDRINADARLGPLSLNGGTTPTHALLGGSQALDQGNRSGYTADQRGAPRPFDIAALAPPSGGDDTDIGAMEMQAIRVTTTASSGPGSLNAAVITADLNPLEFNDILFASPLFDTAQTIDLLTALPDIDTNATINGPGASLLKVMRDNAAPDFSVFNIPAIGAKVAISGMTISNGKDGSGSGVYTKVGGGIFSSSDLSLTGVHVTGNQAANGGGGILLYQAGGTISNSTISGNSSGAVVANGGGIYYVGQGGNSLLLTNSTVSGNVASTHGAGLFVDCVSATCLMNVVNGTIANNVAADDGGIFTGGSGGVPITTLRNSIIANNAPNNLSIAFPSGGATITSLGFNLASDNGGGFLTASGDQINSNPRLAPLHYYGGLTPTHALLDASPALDAGDSSGATSDQRGFGFLRPVNLGLFGSPPRDAADIGAWEAQSRDIIFINGFDSD